MISEWSAPGNQRLWLGMSTRALQVALRQAAGSLPQACWDKDT